MKKWFLETYWAVLEYIQRAKVSNLHATRTYWYSRTRKASMYIRTFTPCKCTRCVRMSVSVHGHHTRTYTMRIREQHLHVRASKYMPHYGRTCFYIQYIAGIRDRETIQLNLEWNLPNYRNVFLSGLTWKAIASTPGAKRMLIMTREHTLWTVCAKCYFRVDRRVGTGINGKRDSCDNVQLFDFNSCTSRGSAPNPAKTCLSDISLFVRFRPNP